jgi:putative addiction module component (TIGR02574 family)
MAKWKNWETMKAQVVRGVPRVRYNIPMTQQALELLQKALTLPEQERTALVRSLIESLEEVSDQGAELAWDEEIGRRIAELESGKAKTVSWKEVRQRISAKLDHDK